MNLTTADMKAIARDMPDGPAKRSVLSQLRAEPVAVVIADQPRPQSRGGTVAMPRHVTGRMNKTEAEYSRRLEMQVMAGTVRWWKFEPVKVRLAEPGEAGPRGVWYGIDFLVCDADGQLFFDEVKGGWITEDGALKWRWATEQYPYLRFRMWQKPRGGDWECIRQSNVVRRLPAQQGQET